MVPVLALHDSDKLDIDSIRRNMAMATEIYIEIVVNGASLKILFHQTSTVCW